jgi:hypothetical protein
MGWESKRNAMREYYFDLGRVQSLDDWWDMYTKVVRGPGWEVFGRNRDAYWDSLVGGPGGPETPCRFIFMNVSNPRSPALLEHTRTELEAKKARCHSSHVESIEAQIDLLRFGIGETLFNWIIDPVVGVDGIEVVVRADA